MAETHRKIEFTPPIRTSFDTNFFTDEQIDKFTLFECVTRLGDSDIITVWQDDLKRFEDDYMEGLTITEDEHTEYQYPTTEDRKELRELIGEYYDAFLNDDIDVIILE